VFLENKPGALSGPCRLLAQAGVNILTFALADTQQYGILRLVVHDWAKAKRLLEEDGYVVRESDVVALEVDDRPGGLAAILDAVETAGINVEYVYAFTAKQGSKGLMLFRFKEPAAAVTALKAAGIDAVDSGELFRRSAS
jgi:hypothetical protein